MPQTTPERAARWPGADTEAIEFLSEADYTLNRDWSWTRPNPDHVPTEREIDAIVYLMEEWDFDGLRSPQNFRLVS